MQPKTSHDPVPFKLLGYVRVSTENQLENYSIEEQSERIRAYCLAKDWQLLKIYTDGGFSGGNINRPALQEMLDEVSRNPVDAVIVYKLDRLSRSQKDTLTLIEDKLLSRGTDFISICENFDTSTPFGRAMIGILSVFAQLEKDQITERFTMGRIGRGKAGYFHGGGNAPTGYDYIDGMLQINEYEAMQIREVFRLFLGGESINSIMRTLNAGYTSKWTAAKVRNVLRNSLYIGKVKFRGVEYTGAHTPIISSVEYNAVNRLLNSPVRDNKKRSCQKTPFRAGYLLSSLIYCGRCGARYSANHGYYKCYSRSKSSKNYVVDPDCCNDNWPIEELDNIIVDSIFSLLTVPSASQDIFSTVPEVSKIDRNAIERRIKAIEVQIEKLIDLYQVSEISADTLTQRICGLKNERTALETQLQNAQINTQAEDYLTVCNSDFAYCFEHTGLEKQRQLVSCLVEFITVDGPAVDITWRI